MASECIAGYVHHCADCVIDDDCITRQQAISEGYKFVVRSEQCKYIDIASNLM
jgi:hypothetical protein